MLPRPRSRRADPLDQASGIVESNLPNVGLNAKCVFGRIEQTMTKTTTECAMMTVGQVLIPCRSPQPQSVLRMPAKTNRRVVLAERYKLATDTGLERRFTVMCVPGEHDDGSDAGWHVYDRRSRTSSKVGTGTAGEELAIDTAHEANRVSRCREDSTHA
jgi:hypothetical protein